MICFWLLKVPTVTLYCTVLTSIFKKTEIGNPLDQLTELNKIPPLKLKTSTGKIYMIQNMTSKQI